MGASLSTSSHGKLPAVRKHKKINLPLVPGWCWLGVAGGRAMLVPRQRRDHFLQSIVHREINSERDSPT